MSSCRVGPKPAAHRGTFPRHTATRRTSFYAGSGITACPAAWALSDNARAHWLLLRTDVVHGQCGDPDRVNIHIALVCSTIGGAAVQAGRECMADGEGRAKGEHCVAGQVGAESVYV